MGFFDRLVVPILQMVFGIWYISYMFPTWVNVEPFVIGKVTQFVISWEKHPIIYAVSIAISSFGAIACFCFGFTSIFNIGYLWRKVWKR